MTTRISTVLSAIVLWACSQDVRAVVWTVVNTDSTGAGSLKAAIDSANAGSPAVADTIVFAIPGTGPHVLSRRSSLIVTAPGLLIDGYSQPGASVNTLDTGNNAVLKVVLTTDTVNVGGLRLFSDGCSVRGLVLGGLVIGLEIQSGSHGVVEGNYIGLDTAGTSAFSNEVGVFLVSSDSSRVGGPLPAQRNIISANSNCGIYVIGGDGVLVAGNYIGTNKHGTSDLGNITGVFTQTTTGMAIGGTAPGSGNLISGNVRGIYLALSTADTRIQGNLIGTDITGLLNLGNSLDGIDIENSSQNTVGGLTAASRNVIAGTPFRNVYLTGDSDSNQVIGNFIGTDRTGLASLGGNGSGILLAVSAHDNMIGGPTPAHRNIIAGCGTYAIQLTDSTSGNVTMSNYIGVGADGSTALGNGGGVQITGITNDNWVGSYLPLQGNTIAHSALYGGVVIDGALVFENRILSNSIHDNMGLGIDLGGDGVTANDTLDADAGPNNLMNHPVLTSATHLDTGILLEGVMMGEQGEASLIQVFWNSDCDPTGSGEGEALIDSFTVVKDATFGLAPFSRYIDSVPPVGSYLSATATWAGSTSEFSECVTILPQAVNDTLRLFLFSPVSMVVTDPVGDSIGIDSASGVIFNTILNASTYDTTSDVNSPGLTGPDGSEDDVVTIPNPLAGEYEVRLFVSDTTSSTSFTMALRINGNQLLVPDDYQEQSITALGTTISPVVVWTAATTLPGDANADGNFTSADIIFLVNYVFKSGPATPVPGHGDVDCSGAVTAADIILMVNFIFKSGPPPCSQSGG